MNSVFKKVVLFCSLSFLAGSAVFAFTVSKPAKETDATNIGSDSLIPIILSTNSYKEDSVTLTANSKKYTMRQIQTTSTSSIFAINALKSDVYEKTLSFKGSHFNFSTSYNKSTFTYKVTGSSTGSSVTSADYGVPNRYRESSSSTRRLWFTFTSSINGFIGLEASSRFLLNKIHNNIDDRDYYFVDIPSDRDTFSMEYINPNATDLNEILASNTYTNAELHKIHLVDPTNKTISEYSPTGLDQYLINEYLRGFSSCSDSDINGYNAYPYISNIVSHFTSYESGTLSDVSQDDYLKSDYVDDEYASTSIRGGMSVTAQEKLDEIQHNYLAHQNRPIIYNNDSNMNIWIITFSSLLTITAVSSYIFIKKKSILSRQ